MPRVVRYLKTATLIATLRESNGASGQIVSNKILPPLLVVEYGEISVPVESESPRAVAAALAALDPPITAPSTFTAVYTMEMDNSFETINYFFVIAVVFFGLVWQYPQHPPSGVRPAPPSPSSPSSPPSEHSGRRRMRACGHAFPEVGS